MQRRLLLLIGCLALGMFFLDDAAAELRKDSVAVIDASRYESLQAALDAIPDGGGVVRIPPGSYQIDVPLVLSKGNTRVVGVGAATHIINRNTDGQPALLITRADSVDENGRKRRIWGIQLADFRVSGNESSGDGIRLVGINELYANGLNVEHNGGHGLNLIDCYENPRVTESNITYNGSAGLNVIGGHDVVVNGNQFEENRYGVRFIDGFNLTMTGNNLDDHLDHGVVIENSYGSVLSGNTIEESKGSAIVLDRDAYGITVGSNVFANNAGGGVDLRDAWGISISSNTFSRIPGFSIRVGPESGRIAITGNNFSDAYIGGGERRVDAPSSGVELIRTTAVTVTGNIFSGMAESAIRLQGDSEHVVLTGNVMLDVSRAEQGRHPAVDGALPSVHFEHNVVDPADH